MARVLPKVVYTVAVSEQLGRDAVDGPILDRILIQLLVLAVRLRLAAQAVLDGVAARVEWRQRWQAPAPCVSRWAKGQAAPGSPGRLSDPCPPGGSQSPPSRHGRAPRAQLTHAAGPGIARLLALPGALTSPPARSATSPRLGPQGDVAVARWVRPGPLRCVVLRQVRAQPGDQLLEHFLWLHLGRTPSHRCPLPGAARGRALIANFQHHKGRGFLHVR